ncbi:MAG: glycosyltransferase [Ignavibacteria bacterium]
MNVLFIVDGSLSNPVLPSQGIPHIQENSKKGVNYFILSFEDPQYIGKNPKEKERHDAAYSNLNKCARVFSAGLKKNKRFSTFRLILKGLFSASRIIRKHKIDIVHGRSNLPSLLGVLLKKIFNIKVLYDNRGLLSDELDEMGKLRIKVEILFEKYILKTSDSIVVVSHAFKNHLCSKYPSYNLDGKLRVIENSFSEKRFFYSDQLREKYRREFGLHDKFVMVYSGHAGSWQRFDFTLETFKKLKGLKKEAYLLIISYDDDIEEKILKAGVAGTDFAVYNLLASEVGKYLITADFGVNFRDNNRLRSRVSAPIKLGEYLASGLPVLSMNKIGDSEMILNKYETGIIIENELEVKQKLLELIELVKDPEVRMRCRRTAEECLSVKVSAEKYLSIYKNLLIK